MRPWKRNLWLNFLASHVCSPGIGRSNTCRPKTALDNSSSKNAPNGRPLPSTPLLSWTHFYEEYTQNRKGAEMDSEHKGPSNLKTALGYIATDMNKRKCMYTVYIHACMHAFKHAYTHMCIYIYIHIHMIYRHIYNTHIAWL